MTHPQDTTPANPAQGVSDEAVLIAGDILMQHGLNAPEQVIYQAARAALTAAIGAGGQAVAEVDKSGVIQSYDWWDEQGGNQPGTKLFAHPAPSGQVRAIREWINEAIRILSSGRIAMNWPDVENHITQHEKEGKALLLALASLSQPAKGAEGGE